MTPLSSDRCDLVARLNLSPTIFRHLSDTIHEQEPRQSRSEDFCAPTKSLSALGCTWLSHMIQIGFQSF